MITKVYETITKTREEKVKKTRTLYKTEYYEEDEYVKEKKKDARHKYHCGRCGSYYHYGDNKMHPYNCPYCVCICCGDSLENRVRYTASGQKVDRCWSCWSAGRYPDHSRRISYHSTATSEDEYEWVTKKVKKSREVPYEEEYEEIEKITESFDKLRKVINIDYNKDNNVLVKELDFKKFNMNNLKQSEKTTFKPKLDTKSDNFDSEWFGDNSFHHAYKTIKLSKENKISQKVYCIKDIPYNLKILSEKQELKEFCDVVGFYPNVPAFIQGHPLNMYNNKRVNKRVVEKSINIYVNLAIDSTDDRNQYFHRGIIIHTLLKYLKEHKAKTCLTLLDATYVNGETYIAKMFITNDDLYKNLDEVYNMITKISFYRLILLNDKLEYLSKHSKNYDEWTLGKGYCLSNDDLRKVLGLNSNDILIGSPSQHGITGIYQDDDYAYCLDSIGLYASEPKYTIQNKKVLDVEKIIKKRKITKLIHVTNIDNIESIKQNGILSVADLESNKIEYANNDNLRLDNHLDAISLSITEPNEFLFNCFLKKYPHNHYQVIEIDPSILYDKDINRIYSDYNAASKYSETSDNDLNIMFKDEIRRKSKIKTRINKRDCDPTSNQAEILYFGKIDPKYILNIYDYESSGKL